MKKILVKVLLVVTILGMFTGLVAMARPEPDPHVVTPVIEVMRAEPDPH